MSEEVAQLLTEAVGTPDALGQRLKSWIPNAGIIVGVQPLGAEEQERMGLTAGVERLRVQLPPTQLFQVGGRLRLRGRDWKAVRVEAWSSYTLAVCEGV